MSALTDRELLELAAKAAGYDTHGYDMLGDVGMWVCEKGAEPFDGELPIFAWMPLADDGDALRLAVKLGIEWHKPSRSRSVGRVVQAWFPPDGNPQRAAVSHVSEVVNGDPLAATRRAIVRAAAALTQGA